MPLTYNGITQIKLETETFQDHYEHCIKCQNFKSCNIGQALAKRDAKLKQLDIANEY